MKEMERQKKKEASAEKKAEALKQKLEKQAERERKKQARKTKNKENVPFKPPPSTQVTTQPLTPSTSSSHCMKCGGVETDECEEDWVACDCCALWWHISCTNIDPTMSPEALDNLTWYYNLCDV